MPFDLAEESAGTQTWFALIGPALTALRTRSDPVCSMKSTRACTRSCRRACLSCSRILKTNPHGAQLIFTTHDTSLLNYLNRDEVWLTEKG